MVENSSDDTSDETSQDASNFSPFEGMSPQEEVLVRLFTSGKTTHTRSELADSIGCSPTDIEETLDTLATGYVLLTDGDSTDPQYALNPLLNVMGELTRFYILLTENELTTRIEEYESRLESYREKTGVNTPTKYLEGLRSGDIEPIGLDEINEPFWEAQSWHDDQYHLDMLKLYANWRETVNEQLDTISFDPVDPFERDVQTGE